MDFCVDCKHAAVRIYLRHVQRCKNAVLIAVARLQTVILSTILCNLKHIAMRCSSLARISEFRVQDRTRKSECGVRPTGSNWESKPYHTPFNSRSLTIWSMKGRMHNPRSANCAVTDDSTKKDAFSGVQNGQWAEWRGAACVSWGIGRNACRAPSGSRNGGKAKWKEKDWRLLCPMAWLCSICTWKQFYHCCLEGTAPNITPSVRIEEFDSTSIDWNRLRGVPWCLPAVPCKFNYPPSSQKQIEHFAAFISLSYRANGSEPDDESISGASCVHHHIHTTDWAAYHIQSFNNHSRRFGIVTPHPSPCTWL